ncbi:MAG: hypothetical protein R3A13_01060 [Bdellovibrionota bacterium]
MNSLQETWKFLQYYKAVYRNTEHVYLILELLLITKISQDLFLKVQKIYFYDPSFVIGDDGAKFENLVLSFK